MSDDPSPSPASAPEEPRPSLGDRFLPRKGPKVSRKFQLFLLAFLVVSQSLLVFAAIVPYWWAALPVISLTGVVGWKSRWVFAPLLGFLVGFGYWGAELLYLPAIPRARLAAVLSGALSVSPTVVYLIGPLLLGLLGAFSAMTAAGALRLYDQMMGPDPDPSAAEGASTTAAAPEA